MKSFNGDATLKADLIDEMKKHQEADDLIKGAYARENGRFRGCAIGCSIQSLIVRRGVSIDHGDHSALGEAIGAPEWLIRLQEVLFENLPGKKAKEFPVRFYESMPIGVDLEPVKWKFCAFIMRENIERVRSLRIDMSLKEKVLNSIRDVFSVHENAIKTGRWDESAAKSAAESAEESAAAAAKSAAKSAAAESAAESAAAAAESAAKSAAESALAAKSAAKSARLAAYIRYAEELLRIMREEGRVN